MRRISHRPMPRSRVSMFDPRLSETFLTRGWDTDTWGYMLNCSNNQAVQQDPIIFFVAIKGVQFNLECVFFLCFSPIGGGLVDKKVQFPVGKAVVREGSHVVVSILSLRPATEDSSS